MSEKTAYLFTGGPASDPGSMTEDFRIVLQACGNPAPSVAYIGTANHENEAFFQRISKPVLDAGAGEITLVPIISEHADTEKAKRILSRADAIFLSGGEVEDGIMGLRKFGLDSFLGELYQEGKLFFGVSAGAIMLGQYWVHWDVEDDDDTASLFKCLDFVPMTFDAHGENEDWRELKFALRLLGKDSEGFGLSAGGFYSAKSTGRLTAFRNGPAVFHNNGKDIEQKTEGYLNGR